VCCIVSSRCLVTTSEQTEDFSCAVFVVICRAYISEAVIVFVLVVTCYKRPVNPISIQTPCLVTKS
jgi:hypothetical protein